MVLALLIAGGLTLWLMWDAGNDWSNFGGSRQGWEVAVPPGWQTQSLTGDQCQFLGYRDAVWVTSTSFTFKGPTPGDPEECFGRFIRAGFPREGAALLVQPTGIGIGLFRPDCRYPPVGLAELKSADVHRTTVKVRYADLCVKGMDGEVVSYMLRAWIGRDVSSADRGLLDRVVSSFRFLRRPSG